MGTRADYLKGRLADRRAALQRDIMAFAQAQAAYMPSVARARVTGNFTYLDGSSRTDPNGPAVYPPVQPTTASEGALDPVLDTSTTPAVSFAVGVNAENSAASSSTASTIITVQDPAVTIPDNLLITSTIPVTPALGAHLSSSSMLATGIPSPPPAIT
jgi:hypothetical protein